MGISNRETISYITTDLFDMAWHGGRFASCRFIAFALAFYQSKFMDK